MAGSWSDQFILTIGASESVEVADGAAVAVILNVGPGGVFVEGPGNPPFPFLLSLATALWRGGIIYRYVRRMQQPPSTFNTLARLIHKVENSTEVGPGPA
jgi:hypothetical protein